MKKFAKKYGKENLTEDDRSIFGSNLKSCVSIKVAREIIAVSPDIEVCISVKNGSGFIIDKKHGLIITNFHVIAEANQIKNESYKLNKIRIGFNNIVGYVDAEILHIAPEYDMAIVKVDPELLERYPNRLEDVVLDNREVTIGEKVYLIGNALGTALKNAKDGVYEQSGTIMRIMQPRLIGTIVNFINIIQWKLKELSASSLISWLGLNYAGNSGGPVFDKNGNVLGIYNSGSLYYTIAKFIHSPKIIAMLEKAKESGLQINYKTVELVEEQFTFESSEKIDLSRDRQTILIT